MKLLAARALLAASNFKAPRAETLPDDLLGLVIQAHAPGWVHYDAKDPTCESLAGVVPKVGSFALFPDACVRVCPTMWTVDLVALAPHTLQFLDLCASAPALLEERALRDAACVRYPLWMQLLQSVRGAERLVPPLDVARVWFSHMLQSAEYRRFAASFGLEWEPHACTWCFDDTESFNELMHRSRLAWARFTQGACMGVPCFGAHTRAASDMPWVSWNSAGRRPRSPSLPTASAPAVAPSSESRGLGCGMQARDPRMQCGAMSRGGGRVDVDAISLRPAPYVDRVDKLDALPAVVRGTLRVGLHSLVTS